MNIPERGWNEVVEAEQDVEPDSVTRHAARVTDFLAEVSFHAGREDKDVYISHAAKAMLFLYGEHEGFRGAVKQAAYERPISPTYMFNLWLKQVQANCIDDDAYPYESSEMYGAKMCELLQEPVLRRQFLEGVTTHELQSNISERYKAVRIIIEALKPRLGCQPSMLDIGTSVGNGLKQLAFMPFGRINLVAPEHADPLEAELIEMQINTILSPYESNFSPIGYGVGVDLIEPTELTQHRARSDSFNPAELKDKNKLALYDVLEIAEPPNVHFEYKNLLEGDQLETVPEGGFDLLTMITMAYQIGSSDFKDFIGRRCLELISDKGVLLVTDFAEPSPEDPTELLFYKNWYAVPFRYRTMLFDPRTPELGFQVLFEWRDGRATEMRPSELGWQLLKAM